MTNQHRIAVLGGGSFGTVIANIMANNGHHVCLWLRNAERADEINQQHLNSAYLPDYPLNPSLTASTDLAAAVTGCDIVFMAVPSRSCREVARELAEYIADGAILVSTTKGIEPDGFGQSRPFQAKGVAQGQLGSEGQGVFGLVAQGYR